MPMGPLRLIDEIGVDITIDIAATLEKAYGARNKTASAHTDADAEQGNARPEERLRLL